MNFGIENIKTAIPASIGWVLGISGSIMTALAGINVLYPTIITEHIIAEAGKIFGLVGILAPFFGVKKEQT